MPGRSGKYAEEHAGERFAEQLARLPGRRRALEAGETLFLSGAPVRHVHVVLGGLVNLVRPDPDGNPALIQRAGAGDVLAEASLYSSHYHCDGVAAEPATVYAVSRDRVRREFGQHPTFAGSAAAHFARELQRQRFLVSLLRRRTVAARLDAWLGWHGDRLPPRGRWRAIADEMGVSPEALYRELARRRRDG